MDFPTVHIRCMYRKSIIFGLFPYKIPSSNKQKICAIADTAGIKELKELPGGEFEPQTSIQTKTRPLCPQIKKRLSNFCKNAPFLLFFFKTPRFGDSAGNDPQIWGSDCWIDLRLLFPLFTPNHLFLSEGKPVLSRLIRRFFN